MFKHKTERESHNPFRTLFRRICFEDIGATVTLLVPALPNEISAGNNGGGQVEGGTLFRFSVRQTENRQNMPAEHTVR